MARQVGENPVYSRLLKERFVDSISVFHYPDLWLQSIKATTTYLA
jgi:hypothetical protein